MNSHWVADSKHCQYFLLAVWAPVLGGPPSLLVQEVYSKRKHHLLIELVSLFCFDSMKIISGIQRLLCGFVSGGLILPSDPRKYSLPPSDFLGRVLNKECGFQ